MARRNPEGEITGEELRERHEGLVLFMRAVPNPDYEGGHAATVSIPWRAVPIATLEQARRLWGEFAEDNDLGAGNLAGGGIALRGKPYARISPNGRIWRYQPDDRYAFPSTHLRSSPAPRRRGSGTRANPRPMLPRDGWWTALRSGPLERWYPSLSSARRAARSLARETQRAVDIVRVAERGEHRRVMVEISPPWR